MRRTYSTVEVARRLGVSVQSVQRWVDLGRLKAWKTPGGHRRIDADDAEQLFRAFAEGNGEADLLAEAPDSASAPVPQVLVVDDAEPDRELACTLVQAALPTAVIVTAATGFEALVAAGRQTFDVLISDLVMPNMSGVEMFRHLASEGPHRPRFLLATSSYSEAERRKLGLLPPDVSFLPKPLDGTALAAWLRARVPAGPAAPADGASSPPA